MLKEGVAAQQGRTPASCPFMVVVTRLWIKFQKSLQ